MASEIQTPFAEAIKKHIVNEVELKENIYYAVESEVKKKMGSALPINVTLNQRTRLNEAITIAAAYYDADDEDCEVKLVTDDGVGFALMDFGKLDDLNAILAATLNVPTDAETLEVGQCLSCGKIHLVNRGLTEYQCDECDATFEVE